MNSNRSVFHFVLYSVGILLAVSVAGALLGFKWLPFNRVNLVSDVFGSKDTAQTQLADGGVDTTNTPVIVEKLPSKEFMLYQQPKLITDFNADTNTASLQGFLTKLRALKNGEKRKVRIAYFGDSMIEGDLLTQTFRQLLQQSFGGSGVGFVPITSPVAKFRQTVSTSNAGSWDDENFKNAKTNRLYISGHIFRGSGATVQMTDQTIQDSTAIIEKTLLCGATGAPVNVTVNNITIPVHADKPVNRVVLSNDGSHTVKLGVSSPELPVYGISFESASGVIVDNFSFRGITGIEYSKIDSSFLAAVSENNPYDLIIFQYGVNLLFRPNDKNFSWYAKMMLPVVKKIRGSFPETDFLLVSTADRAFRYGGEYKSAIGIDSLIKVQALLAYETNSSFYNQFAAMGGTNSIVEWAKAKPSLANQDYVHPNHRGAEILANYLFDALMRDFEKMK
jgi:lysophospholipase L1-like esterase